MGAESLRPCDGGEHGLSFPRSAPAKSSRDRPEVKRQHGPAGDEREDESMDRGSSVMAPVEALRRQPGLGSRSCPDQGTGGGGVDARGQLK